MRILHLIDPGTPGGGACTLRLLAEPLTRLQSIRQDVVLIGNRHHAALARRCGVRPAGLIAPPMGATILAARAVRQMVASFRKFGCVYDLIHAWTPTTALLAHHLASTGPPKMTPPRDHHIAAMATLTVGPVTSTGMSIVLHRLAAALGQRPMPLLAGSDAVRREYASAGLDVRDDDSPLMSVMAPAVNPESVNPIPRRTLRARWGVRDETLVVGLFSEPVAWADARTALSAVSYAAKAGRDVRLVVHPTATRRRLAQQWAAEVGLDDALILEDELAEPWRVTGGLDAALLTSGEMNTMDLAGTHSPLATLTGGGRRLRPMPGVMPLLWAMAAGLPVIAEAGDAVREIITDASNGLLVQQHDIVAVGDRLLRLHDDRTIAGRLGAAGRRMVHDRYHVSRYCVRLKAMYGLLLDPDANVADLLDEAHIVLRRPPVRQTAPAQ